MGAAQNNSTFVEGPICKFNFSLECGVPWSRVRSQIHGGLGASGHRPRCSVYVEDSTTEEYFPREVRVRSRDRAARLAQVAAAERRGDIEAAAATTRGPRHQEGGDNKRAATARGWRQQKSRDSKRVATATELRGAYHSPDRNNRAGVFQSRGCLGMDLRGPVSSDSLLTVLHLHLPSMAVSCIAASRRD